MFDADKCIQTLVQEADACGMDEDTLDEVVHDIASEIATDVNNGGIEAQIAFIIEKQGPAGENTIRPLLTPNAEAHTSTERR